jgi:hypothetical protein
MMRERSRRRVEEGGGDDGAKDCVWTINNGSERGEKISFPDHWIEMALQYFFIKLNSTVEREATWRVMTKNTALANDWQSKPFDYVSSKRERERESENAEDVIESTHRMLLIMRTIEANFPMFNKIYSHNNALSHFRSLFTCARANIFFIAFVNEDFCAKLIFHFPRNWILMIQTCSIM